MENKILKLKKLWNWPDSSYTITDGELERFELINKVVIPNDLGNYFKIINGTDGYDENFFQFFPLAEFKSIKTRFNEWKTVSDIKSLLNIFDQNSSCFVFAEYQIHLFSYVIRLYEKETKQNEIYIFCGNDYHMIANSFSEFIDLCLSDSSRIFFN